MEFILPKTFRSRLFFLGLIFVCTFAGAATSEGVSRGLAEQLLTGHWQGEGKDYEGSFQFHTINCANGRFAVAVERKGQDTFIYFGTWETDGATIIHNSDVSGMFDRRSFEMSSLEKDTFLNLYHIVKLTKTQMVYEWRGESTRRFEAHKTESSSGISRKKLNDLACHLPPSIS